MNTLKYHVLTKRFYSHGKLLLTAEYVVLDGATALAIPTKKGQYLTVAPTDIPGIHWKSFDHEQKVWYEARFEMGIRPKNTDAVTSTLWTILEQAMAMQPGFLEQKQGFAVTTHLEFPPNWGLGSSSTLINNIAQWAEVDPFQLLQESFGGSGYDIAAAKSDSPIFYSIRDKKPSSKPVALPWDFTSELFFVHLNKKQDSKEGIARYRKHPATTEQIRQFSDITKKMLLCYSLSAFEALLEAHEHHIGELLNLTPVKENRFPDYPGSIKSLGAWGGDFILATGNSSRHAYFQERGFHTIVPFTNMIL